MRIALLGVTLASCTDQTEPLAPEWDEELTFSASAQPLPATSITDLQVSSSRSYQIDEAGLVAGTRHWSDRRFSIVDPVPAAVAGQTFLRTPNDDKAAAPGSADFLRFRVDQPVTVYVAHDDRTPRPEWLASGFQDSGLDLRDSDGQSSAYSLFRRDFPAGQVTLGSNVNAQGDAPHGMYSVVVVPAGGSSEPPPPEEDTQAPSTPTGLTASAVSASRIDLAWQASTDDVGVSAYQVYRGSARVATITSTTFSDEGLSAGTTYTYRVSAVDAAGNTSDLSAPASATTASPPPEEGAVPVVIERIASGSSYSVDVGGMEVGTRHWTDRRYSISSPLPAAVEGHTFIRTANEDKASSPGSADFLRFRVDRPVTVYVAHDDRTPRPTWLASGFQDSGLDLRDDDGQSSAYSLFRRDFPAGTVTLGSNVNAEGSSPHGMYSVVVVPAGGSSEPPPPAGDSQAPSTPTGLSARSVSTSQIDLAWQPSSDNVGVSAYHVYRGTQQVGTTSGTSYSDRGLTAGTTYTYRVRAVDAEGNASALSEPASATTASPPPPEDDGNTSGRYPNQPSWSRGSECSLSSEVPSMDNTSANRVAIPGCSDWSTSNGTRYESGRVVSRRLDDSQAPTSASSVWDILFEGGEVYDGVGPGTLFHYTNGYQSGWDGSFYWAFSLKLSENWVHHQTVQKLVHLKTSNGGTIILSFDGNGGPLELYVGGAYHNSNQPGTVSARDMVGKWMRIELRWDASTGRARWWLNGVLQGDHSNLPRTSGLWSHTFFDPTYGGRSSTALPADQRMYIDHVLFSVPN